MKGGKGVKAAGRPRVRAGLGLFHHILILKLGTACDEVVLTHDRYQLCLLGPRVSFS
jgi:hypothetical protein